MKPTIRGIVTPDVDPEKVPELERAITAAFQVLTSNTDLPAIKKFMTRESLLYLRCISSMYHWRHSYGGWCYWLCDRAGLPSTSQKRGAGYRCITNGFLLCASYPQSRNQGQYHCARCHVHRNVAEPRSFSQQWSWVAIDP